MNTSHATYRRLEATTEPSDEPRHSCDIPSGIADNAISKAPPALKGTFASLEPVDPPELQQLPDIRDPPRPGRWEDQATNRHARRT
jgi:hypothetical protein